MERTERPDPRPPTRLEKHFGDRVVRCFEQRWADINEMFLASASTRSTEEAVVCGDRRVSWSALADRVMHRAGGLRKHGVVAGDRVALLLGNNIEFVVVSHAVIMLGAVVVPINTREQTPGLRYILNNCGAVVLIHDAELTPRLPEPRDTPTLRERVSVDQSGMSDDFLALLQGPRLDEIVPVDEEDPALIMYTSGTTGFPKGALISHINVIHSVLHYRHAFQLHGKERGCVTVPLSHVTGLVAMMMTMIGCGGTLIIDPQFKARSFLRLAEQERITYTLMVPAMYNLCLLQPEISALELSEWRIGGYGGSPMPPSAIAMLATAVPSLGLYNIYGSTELSSPIAVMPAHLTKEHPDSVGLPVICGEIAIMDESGREVGLGEIGELWLKGPNVVRGYWENPEASASSFCAGYWRSGDIGRVDESGFLYVLDRIKDLINRGGYKVYSAEVENALSQHPRIREVAAVAKSCPVLGERIHVFVTIDEGDQVDEQEIKAFCAQRLSDYKVPDSCSIGTTPLPRNPGGKILKRELRDRLLATADSV
ncbi:MAG: long-chain fatty acid--CoA ligase, partial [Variovorax sp.]|nr:long-chain fatty acid--CoA ligase [Variovorax sp.]